MSFFINIVIGLIIIIIIIIIINNNNNNNEDQYHISEQQHHRVKHLHLNTLFKIPPPHSTKSKYNFSICTAEQRKLRQIDIDAERCPRVLQILYAAKVIANKLLYK
jgi:hypothetical protein